MVELPPYDDEVIHPRLFKRIKSGTIQIWFIEQRGPFYRTVHGHKGSANFTISEWTLAKPTNVGRKSERNSEQQADFEITAHYTKKVNQGKYSYDLSSVDEATYISPMLAESFNASSLCFPFIAQPKLDGIRCILKADGAWSRKGKLFPAVQFLVDILQPVFKKYPWLILDGELYNHELHEDFEVISSLVKKQNPTEEELEEIKSKIQYHVYDIVSSEGYEERLVKIDEVFKEVQFTINNYFHKVVSVKVFSEQEFKELYRKWIKDGYEGAMARILGRPYQHSRTKDLQKYKEFMDKEFDLAALEEGKGNWSGVAKRAILWIPGADRSKGIILKTTKKQQATCFAAGIAGTKAYCKKLLDEYMKHVGKPATITFFRYTAYGIPYLPVMKVMRDYE